MVVGVVDLGGGTKYNLLMILWRNRELTCKRKHSRGLDDLQLSGGQQPRERGLGWSLYFCGHCMRVAAAV